MSQRPAPGPAPRSARRKSSNHPPSNRRSDSGSLPAGKPARKPAEGAGESLALYRDVGLALGIVFILFLAAYFYSGNWPPVVLIESGSMEHSDDTSTLRTGTIDTGDLVLVKKVEERDDIITFLEGRKEGHKTYGDFGDVIVYHKNGLEGGTPVIHRAMAWVEVTQVLGETRYIVEDYPHEFSVSTGINIPDIGAEEVGKTGSKYGELKWSGYLTKGDSDGNAAVDQKPALFDIQRQPVQPVQVDFIIGKARGEIPWMGMLKLCLTGQDGCESAPSSQKTMMMTVIGVIVGLLILLAVIPYLIPRRDGNDVGPKSPKSDRDQQKRGNQSHPRRGPGRSSPGKGPPQGPGTRTPPRRK